MPFQQANADNPFAQICRVRKPTISRHSGSAGQNGSSRFSLISRPTASSGSACKCSHWSSGKCRCSSGKGGGERQVPIYRHLRMSINQNKKPASCGLSCVWNSILVAPRTLHTLYAPALRAFTDEAQQYKTPPSAMTVGDQPLTWVVPGRCLVAVMQSDALSLAA